jgi:peptidoglycan hydrolase-like protein with peptidoglycan-binding domain
MSIPGIGIVAVHDRGGAIVPAGERDQAYDRLDVWMGACDEGLYRALTWGVRTVEVTVYGIDDSMEESVYLEGFSYVEQVVNQVIVTPTLLLPEDVWYLSTGEDVERLQTYLQQLGYYQGGITGTYGDETRQAVFAFQVSQGILDSWDDFGAGHTGINTRKMLDLAISKWREKEESQSFQRYQEGLLLLSQYPDLDRNRTSFSQDLALGSSGAEVSRLQTELKNLGYLRIEPTGYFGEVTQHALFKFQQKRGILFADTDSGAGVFGPQTRSAFNAIVEARTQHLSLIALGRHEQVLASQSSAPATAEDMNDLSSVLALGDRGSDVKLLQTLLKNLGFFNGAFVTEFYGEQTKAAVVAFQLANGLIATENDAEAGTVNEATRILLNQLS